MTPIEFEVPIRTVPGLNAREHFMARSSRVKRERTAASASMRRILGCMSRRCASVVSLPAVVTLTRVGPREVDSDNLVGACKGVRDGVAAFLGVDDGSDWVTWAYAQDSG
jgi:hypothetical protein